MLVVFAAVRSSPGVTTSTLVVGSSLDGAVIVEADWDGGVLGTRFGLPREPGLNSFAAVARANPHAELATHAHELSGGTLVVPAPASADSAIGVWRSAGQQLAGALRAAAEHRPVLVDAGRLNPLAPHAPLLDVADDVVVVTRPMVEELHAVTTRLDSLRSSASGRVSVLLVGEWPYNAAEVAAQLHVDVLGSLAEDRRAADSITGRGPALSARALRRSALARSARNVAEVLAASGTNMPDTDTEAAPA